MVSCGNAQRLCPNSGLMLKERGIVKRDMDVKRWTGRSDVFKSTRLWCCRRQVLRTRTSEDPCTLVSVSALLSTNAASMVDLRSIAPPVQAFLPASPSMQGCTVLTYWLTSACEREQMPPRSLGAVPLDVPLVTKLPPVEARQASAPHAGTLNCLELRPAGRDQTLGMAAATTAI